MPILKLYNNLNQKLVEIKIPCKFGRENGELTFPSDDSVSTLHGEFKISGKVVYLVDLDSTNGTYINEQLITPNNKFELNDDDLLQFGEQSFHIGVSDNFRCDNIHERYIEKKAQRMRDRLSASKADKVKSIENKVNSLKEKKKKIQDQLFMIKEKYKNGKLAQTNLMKKKSTIDKNIDNFSNILNEKIKSLDAKKRRFYQSKQTLDDQVKLLKLSGASEDKISELDSQLATTKQEIAAIAEEKKNFPKKVNQLKKNQEIMAKTIIETTAKLTKVENIIRENEAKYEPVLERIENQLNQLNREKEKLEPDSTRTRRL